MESRKRVGIMMPSADGTAEPDFQLVLTQQGVAVHGHRLWQDDNRHDPEEHFQMMNNGDRVGGALPRLRAPGRDRLLLHHRQLLQRPRLGQRDAADDIEGASGVPAFATTPSVVKALEFKGAKKISAISPYPEWNNIKLREYMEARGFEVSERRRPPQTLPWRDQGVRAGARRDSGVGHREVRPRRRRPVLLLHRLALHGGRRAAGEGDRQAGDNLQPGHAVADNAAPGPGPTGHGLRQSAGDPRPGVAFQDINRV